MWSRIRLGLSRFLSKTTGLTGLLEFCARPKKLRVSRESGKFCLAVVGFFKLRDVDLVHLHHGVHDAFGFRFIRIAEHVAENDRADLPREAEFVFEPPARPGRSAIGGKFFPEIIDLLLRLAVHVERDRFGELELRAAVECYELNSVERKLHRHDRSRLASNLFRSLSWIARDLSDLRIFKNADVEFRCFLRFRIEP